MSGDADKLPGGAFSSTERGKARRFLLSYPTFMLGMTLISLNDRFTEVGPLGLFLHVLPLALMAGSLTLFLRRPLPSPGRLGRPALRRIARLAEVPELGAMIVFYGSVIVAVSISTFSLVAFYRTP